MNRAELIEGLKERLLQLNVEQIALRGLIEIYGRDGDSSMIYGVSPGQLLGDAVKQKHEAMDTVDHADDGFTLFNKGLRRMADEAMDVALEPIAKRGRYDWDAVKEMYDTDATIREIAEKFNMPKSTIQTHAHRHGWKKRYKKWEPQQKPAPGKKGVKKGEAFWDCVRSDWENSTDSVRKISRDMAVAESAIHYHAKKEGWGPRPKKATRQSDSLTPQRSSLTLMVQCPSCGNHTQGKSDYTCGHCHVLLPTSMRT